MGQATVQKDIAPVYESPNQEAACIDEALYGMSIQVMEESNTGWCYARTDYGTEGYMLTAGLSLSAEVAVAWRKYKKHIVLAPYVDVQREPLATSGTVITIPRGGTIVALKAPDVNGWQKVGLADGKMGFTRASYLGEAIEDWTLLHEDDMRWNLVESALAYNGTAFRAGGRTPQGIDSVGLAAMTYLLNGVIIPREPFIKQGSALHRIPPEALEEGDLIYFRDAVGVFMGDGRFVHSTEYVGSEGVVVSSLRPRDEDYREDLANHILGAASLF